MDIKTVEDVQALVGKTFGSGKNARTVDRIERLVKRDWGHMTGRVYWGRPGGKVRKQSQYLGDFLDWLRKAEKDANRVTISCVADVENVTGEVPDNAILKGYVERNDNKVTIVYEVIE